MILANGHLLPDDQLPQVLSRLEGELLSVLACPPLEPEAAMGAAPALLERLDSGELAPLLAQYASPQLMESIAQYRQLLTPESLGYKLKAETGGLIPETDRPFGRSTVLPLGVLLHITAGNLDGLPAFSAVEGLLTGNINLVKLPSGDTGLSLALLKLLADTEPRLAPYLYVFPIPSRDQASLQALARLADGIVTWGGEDTVRAVRALAPPGCRLIEWGHRLSFAYLSGPAGEEALAGLAEHIIRTAGLLCSSCQVIYLDADRMEALEEFAHTFLPILERAARGGRRSAGQTALSTLHGWEHLLERAADGSPGQVLRGRGCSVTLCPDRDLELSPLYGNVLVKCLPRREIISVLGRQRGRLQTAGLLCPPSDWEELSSLLARAGVTRVTPPGGMSDPLLGEGHDGEYPLRRYLRVVDLVYPS